MVGNLQGKKYACFLEIYTVYRKSQGIAELLNTFFLSKVTVEKWLYELVLDYWMLPSLLVGLVPFYNKQMIKNQFKYLKDVKKSETLNALNAKTNVI